MLIFHDICVHTKWVISNEVTCFPLDKNFKTDYLFHSYFITDFNFYS